MGLLRETLDGITEYDLPEQEGTSQGFLSEWLQQNRKLNAAVNARADFDVFGGDGDQRSKLILAAAAAADNGVPLFIPKDPNGPVQVAAASGVAIPIESGLTVIMEGTLELLSPTAADRLFSIEVDDEDAAVELIGIRSTGATRHDLVGLDASSNIGILRIIGAVGGAQAFRLAGDVQQKTEIAGVLLGADLTASSAGSPFISFGSSGTKHMESVEMRGVTIRQGIDAQDAVQFELDINSRVEINGLTHFDLSPDTGNARDVLDCDGIGPGARISNVYSYGGHFEYKTGSAYWRARDAVMSNLVVENAKGPAFSFRSSCDVTNARAINPNGTSFYCADFAASDTNINEVDIRLRGLTAINGGAASFGGMTIGMNVYLDGFTVRPDIGTTHETANGIAINAPISRANLRNLSFHRCEAGIRVDPDETPIDRIDIDGMVCRVVDTPLHLQYINRITIRNPDWTGWSATRPITIIDEVQFLSIECDDIDYIGSLFTASPVGDLDPRPRIGRVNGTYVDPLATAGSEPTVSDLIPVGNFVRHLEEGAAPTLWYRESPSSTASTAYAKVTLT